MTTKTDMETAITQAAWYKKVLEKIQDKTFSFSWLSDSLAGENCKIAHDAMYKTLDIYLEEERNRNRLISYKFKNINDDIQQIVELLNPKPKDIDK